MLEKNLVWETERKIKKIKINPCSSITIVWFPYRACEDLQRVLWIYFCFPWADIISYASWYPVLGLEKAQESYKSWSFLLFFFSLVLFKNTHTYTRTHSHTTQLFFFVKRKTTNACIDPCLQILTALAVIPCLHLPGFCAVLQHLLNPVSINRTFQSYLATSNFTDKHAKTLLKETVCDCVWYHQPTAQSPNEKLLFLVKFVDRDIWNKWLQRTQ